MILRSEIPSSCIRLSRVALAVCCLVCCLFAALVVVPSANALIHNRGTSSNEYANDLPNNAVSNIGIPQTGSLETDIIDGEVVIRSDVSSLTSARTFLDGARVEFSGEAIGDIIDAGNGYVWVNVSDGNALIGVFMKAEDAAQIDTLGRYLRIGTTLNVIGYLNIGCNEHGGELDVHAVTVRALAPGSRQVELFSEEKLRLGLALVVVGGILMILYRRMRKASL